MAQFLRCFPRSTRGWGTGRAILFVEADAGGAYGAELRTLSIFPLAGRFGASNVARRPVI
jgi:hypothetical protein